MNVSYCELLDDAAMNKSNDDYSTYKQAMHFNSPARYIAAWRPKRKSNAKAMG